MTQPPYGGTQQPDGPWPPPRPGQPAGPYGQPGPPAYPPARGQYPPPADPYANPAGTSAFPAQPGQAPYPGGPYPAGPYPGAPAPPAPKKRRALLITSIVLAVVLLLCGGGGLAAWLLIGRTEDGKGADKPEAAVEAFLEAVYTDHDAKQAASLVCSEARDEKEIAKKVDELKGYSDTYKSPRFKWDDPKVDDQDSERATVSVKLRMTTGDEKIADQQLRFTVVKKTGWWVCEVR